MFNPVQPQVQKYVAGQRLCVRPLGASWTGDDEVPVASTGRPLLVIDESQEELQHVRPEEAERLMGMGMGYVHVHVYVCMGMEVCLCVCLGVCMCT